MGSWKDRGNQYIQLVKVLYYKLPTNGKQIPAFPLDVGLGTKPRPQRWRVSVTTLPPWPPINPCEQCAHYLPSHSFLYEFGDVAEVGYWLITLETISVKTSIFQQRCDSLVVLKQDGKLPSCRE